jgi:hypothetical protein
LLEVFEKSHDETDDGGALVSSGFSRSGKYWACSSSIKSSAWVNIMIKDTVAGKQLPDMLDDTKSAGKEMRGSSISFGRIWKKKGGLQLRFHRFGASR